MHEITVALANSSQTLLKNIIRFISLTYSNFIFQESCDEDTEGEMVVTMNSASSWY